MKKNYPCILKSKLLLLILLLLVGQQFYAQCTNGDLYPATTFSPSNTGTFEEINNNAYAGEYCLMNFQTNQTYEFASSVTTDYITITNSSGSTVYAHGVSPVSYSSGTNSGTLRYYIHKSSLCTVEEVDRTRYVRVSGVLCAQATGLAASNVTSNSFQLNWTGTSPSNQFQIYITTGGTPTLNQTVGVFSVTSTNNTTLINQYSYAIGQSVPLDANTTYRVYVRPVCASPIAWSSQLIVITKAFLQCNNAYYGLYPSATYNPVYTGLPEAIVTDAYAGEFCKVNLLSGQAYVFSSSNTSDFMSITNEDGTVVYAYGMTPLSWTSTVTGVVRYFLNRNFCEAEAVTRTRFIRGPQIQSCANPTNLTSNSVTLSSQIINWSSSFTPNNGYDYYLSSNGFVPVSSTTPTGNVSTNSVTLTGLSGVSNYTVYIRANCGTFKSDWIGHTFAVRYCDSLSNLAVANITSNSVLMTFNISGWNGSVGFYVSSSNTPPNSNTTPTHLFGQSASKIISGLNSNTTYYYWARTQCQFYVSPYISGGSFTTNGFMACNMASYGLQPAQTFTPPCNGLTTSILTTANSGTFSNVNISANTTYILSSSRATDYITVTNNAGTAVLASGLTPVVWPSGNNSGVFRYFVHSNSSCGDNDTNVQRTKYISCQPSLANETFIGESVGLFPNPTQGLVTVSAVSMIEKVELFTLLGQKVLQKNIQSTTAEIDISEMASGTYLIKVYTAEAVQTLRAIKE